MQNGGFSTFGVFCQIFGAAITEFPVQKLGTENSAKDPRSAQTPILHTTN